ncbi:MAG: hypothetical protein ABIH46_11145 [Chloroflexota bacterium]
MVTEESRPQDEQTTEEPQRRCPFCDFTYANTRKGRAAYATHVRRAHPEETRDAREQRAVEEQLAYLSPMAQRLHDTLRRVIPRSASVDTIVNVFNREAATLGQNRHRFRSWIQRYGLTQDQLSQVEDELFGVEGAEGTQWTGGPGGPQVMGYVPAPGGGYQPIVFLSQPGYPPQPQGGGGQPILVMSPQQPQPAPAPPQSDPEAREQLRSLNTRFDQLVDLLKQYSPEKQPQTTQPMRRIPLLDDEGVILRDTNRQIIYQEVPYDPTMGTIEMMKAIADITKTQTPPKEVDEEKLVLKLKEELRTERPRDEGRGISAELQKMLDDLKADSQQLGTKFAQLEREGEVTKAVREAVAPLQADLKEIQGRSSMTDSQFTLSHRERMAGIWQGFLTNIVGGVREDMRPLIVQNAVAAMQQLGVPNEIIQGAVSSFNVPTKVGGALKTAIDAARDRWVK